MKSAWRLALVAASVLMLFVTLGAARPFDRVPEGDIVYTQLETLDSAGLLTDFVLPEGELSRLEVAVLVQQSLASYGKGQLTGGIADSGVEDALSGLLTNFEGELSQLGSEVSVPAGNSFNDTVELERRIAYLEAEEEVDVETNEAYADACVCGECDPCCEEDNIEVEFDGDFYIHIQGSATSYTDVNIDDTEQSDLDLYWGELGVNVTDGTWSGRFSVFFDDESDNIDMLEAWAKYHCPCTGGFLHLGRIVMPFGDNDFYFPTYPAVNDLGYAELDAVGGGYDGELWGANAYLFNPDVEIVDEEDNFSDYAFTWDITKQKADECQDGWRLTAGYTSHLASGGIFGYGPFIERVSAYNLFGRYDWGGNRYHLIADYTTAIDEFDAADLDADGDGVGDQPTAMNFEFVYEPVPDTLWGVNYQITDEFADYAETRYGALYGRRLSELTMLKLEYTHGEYGDFVTNSQDTDDTFVAEFNLAF